MRIGAPDPTLTLAAGVDAVREADRVLGISVALDAGIGPVKQRARGVTGGQLVVPMATAQLAGQDFLVGLDRRPKDVAGQVLEPVPTPASMSEYKIARRFTPVHLRGIETGIGRVNETMVSLLPARRCGRLLRTATIDGDATDIEVYGRTKDQAAQANTGALTLRAHLRVWAEAGVPVAAELMGGTGDPRANAVEALDRSVAALPEGVEQIRCHFDAGFFAGDLARACIEWEIEFAIGARRKSSIMAAAQGLGQYTWTPATGMEDTELAIFDYLPGSWPSHENIKCIARRTRIPVARTPRARARKRRTIPKDQLALALQGRIDAVYGFSYIPTNLDVSTEAQLAEVEYWYRHRTDIEDNDCPAPADTRRPVPSISGRTTRDAVGVSVHPARQPGHHHARKPQDRFSPHGYRDSRLSR